jgi:hypothetical protein
MHTNRVYVLILSTYNLKRNPIPCSQVLLKHMLYNTYLK